MIGKNTLIKDNPQLNIRLKPLSHIDIYKYVLWGNNRNDIEKYAKKHSEKLFLTSFDNKLPNVVNINDLTFENLDLYMNNQNIKSLLVEGGNYVHKLFISSQIYEYFYKFVSENIIIDGLSIDNNIIEYLMNDLNQIKKIQLKDNSLHIYN